MTSRLSLPSLLGAWLLSALPAAAQQPAEVYARFSPDVVKVEVLEEATRAPATVGTAFFADDSLLVTNYHVVRRLLFEPDRYLLSLVGQDGIDPGTPALVAVDPPNDLAVLRVDRPRAPGLALSTRPVANGEALYSMGHPADLKTSVVEGVFNGVVEHAFAPLLHFSGSINPGMSGGPTVTEDGEVIGINVATAGNQLSFLIPADPAVRLLEEARATPTPGAGELRRQAGEKLRAFQDEVYGSLLAGEAATTTIRGTTVPTGPSELFDCSANPHQIEDDRYELIEYRCQTVDDMLLDRGGTFDLVYLEHLYLGAGELSALAFHTLLTEWYQGVFDWEAPDNDDATFFRCTRDNVATAEGAELLVAFCARRHLAYEGLYDLLVRTAFLGGDSEGVVSTLRAAPISFENAEAVTARWIEGFAWSR